ncbi:MAG: hypothetical protein IJ735_00940 [Clostridia bacterium]|nr:hypothetical protein [Clostridia bacterium]
MNAYLRKKRFLQKVQFNVETKDLCETCLNEAFCASAAQPDEVVDECDFYDEDVAFVTSFDHHGKAE